MVNLLNIRSQLRNSHNSSSINNNSRVEEEEEEKVNNVEQFRSANARVVPVFEDAKPIIMPRNSFMEDLIQKINVNSMDH